MDKREQLVALIGATEYGLGSLVGKNFQPGFIAKIADHLIANGVVVREKGEWVFDRVSTVCDFEIVKCSNCGYEAFAQSLHVKFGNFCPNCGADMRKGEDDG